MTILTSNGEANTDIVVSVEQTGKRIEITLKKGGLFFIYKNRKSAYQTALSLVRGEKVCFVAKGRQIIFLCRTTKPQ